MAFEHSFYFLRHGETDWNRNGRTQGQLDSSLNELGWSQAEDAAERLSGEPIERIIASPLQRARNTAEVVAKHHGLEVILDDGLKECHLGDHQGEAHGPWLGEYWQGRYDPPNGETLSEFSERVWEAMQQAVAQGPNTLIVAHGGLWIAAHSYVTIAPALTRMPNALPLRVTPAEGRWAHRVIGED